MPKKLPNQNKRISISQAADILGVSVDTLRRWDKKGLIHCERGECNVRYFSAEELEQMVFSKPLNIAEAAEKLGISQTTLKRLEMKGVIKPEKGPDGETFYTKDSIEDFLNEEYFLRKKQLEDSSSLPVMQKISPQEVELVNELPAREAMMSKFLSEEQDKINKLLRFRNAFVFGCLFILMLFALMVTVLTAFFLFFPEDASRMLGYSQKDTYAMMRQSKNEEGRDGRAVLGLQTKADNDKVPVLAAVLKPFSKLSLRIVKAVDQKTYKRIVPTEPIENVNDAFVIDDKGTLVADKPIKISNAGNLRIEDTDVIKNLNSEYIQGRAPGSGEGQLVVFGKDGTIAHLTIKSDNIAAGSITRDKLAPGIVFLPQENSVFSDTIEDGSILNADIAETAAISDTKLSQITASNKVAGSSIQLSSGGGLENSSGLSLLRSCSSGQILKYSGGSWVCAAIASGAVDSVNNLRGALSIDGGGIVSISTSSAGLTITGTELDTLASVTGRGATTTTAVAFNGGITSSSLTISSLNTAGAVVYANGSGVLGVSTQGTSGQCLVSGGSGAPTWGGCGGASWGTIAGTLSDQTDLQTALNGKLSTGWTGSSNLITVGTLTSGGTGAGFTLNFTNSTLSGNVTGSNIDESTLAGLTASNFASANISQWTNNSGYITASTNDTLTNKIIAAGSNTISGITASNLAAGDYSSVINSGTYSINISGNAATATSATSATTASDLSCTNCIGGTEIDESSFGAITGTALTVGSGATTAPLSVRGGVGSNAALIVDQLNSGDVLAASASGATRFRVDGSGNIVATGTVNGATISGGNLSGGSVSGGSLTATAVNGITTGDIVQASGSYADPAWITSLAKSKVGLGSVENTALSTWAGTSNITTVGTLTSGATGAGFTLNFGTSTLSGNITGANISGVDISDDTNLSASDGVTLTGDALTNTDKGSSQSIFKNIAVSGQSNVVTDANSDTLTFAAGSNVTITTDASTDTVTIAATDTNTTYSAGTDLDLTGTTFSLETTLDSVDTINLAGIGTLNGLDAIDATTETTLESVLDIGGDVTGTGLSSVSLASNVVDDAELVDSLTYTGTLTIANNALAVNSDSITSDGTTLTINAAGNVAIQDVLSVQGGYGSRAAVIVDQLNSGDILAASASGTTRFRVDGSGNVIASGTVNGATISGGTLTATAVNGVTTADIVLTSGSYADPAWITSLTKSKVGLGNVENTALSTWAGTSNIATVGTLTSGGTGAGFTLSFTNSTLSGNIGGSNIDESTLSSIGNSSLTNSSLSVTAGSGLTGGGSISLGGSGTVNIGAGNGITVNADDVAVNLTTTGNTGSTSSNSGLEVGSGGLTLLKGCADNELIKYTDAGGWACAADNNSGGGGGSSNWVLNSANGTLNPVNNTLDFLLGGTSTSSAKFAVTNIAGGAGAAVTLSSGGSSGLTLDSASGTVSIAAGDTIGNGTWSINSSGTSTNLTATDLSCTNCIGGTEVDESAFGAITGTSLNAGSGTITTTGTIGTAGATTLVGSTVTLGAGATSAVFSARGGIGSNAALIVDQLNSGDILAASASGTTKFRVDGSGNIVATGAVNGATISGGTLSGGTVSGGTLTTTAVNGVTTGDIVLTSGSYSDPAWITSLAKSKVGLGNVENTALSTWTGTSNITTVGTLTSGLSVAAGQGIDTSAAGALAIGNNNATSVSLCNSTACDTISIGTNADADTITIGEVNDEVSLTDAQWSITGAGAASFASVTTGGDTINDFTGTGLQMSGNSLTAVLGASIANSELDANTIDFDKITDSSSLDTDWALAAGAGEDITVNKTFTNNTTENGVIFNFTASDTGSATTGQYGLYLDNLASTEGLDASVVIDNSDADDSIAAGIKFIDAGGGFTALIDNNGILLSGAELNRLDGKDAALVDTNDGVSTAITGTGTLTSGATGAGFTLNFGTSTLSGNVGGSNIDESTLTGIDISSSTNLSASSGVTLTGDALSLDQAFAPTWTSAHTFSLAETEDLQIDISISGTNAGQGMLTTLTNSSSSGNQYGVYIDNAASTGTTESLLVLDNSDTDTAVTNAIQFVNAGGGFTNLFDVAGTTISSGEFTLLDTGIALSELTDSGTLTAGTVDINGGAIDGTTIGATSRSSGAFTTVASNSTVTLGDGSGTDNITLDDGAGSITFTGYNSCTALETNSSGVLTCGTDDTSAGGGITTIEENDVTVVSSATNLDFLGTDFVVGAVGAEGNVSIDYASSGITRLSQNETITGDWAYNFASTEALDISSDIATAGTLNILSVTGTPSSTNGTIRGFAVINASSANANGIDTGILIDNADDSVVMSTGLGITSSGGGAITTALDVSASAIGTALAIGSNDITTTSTTIAATELDRLDGKDAALVDQNDLTSGDGVGGTSSGSGLEAGTGGIGLLQGCSDGQVLKWTEASSVWGCASDNGPTTKYLSANHAIASTTATEVTSISTTLAAGTYVFQYHLVDTTATGTVSPMYGVNFTGTASKQKMTLRYTSTGTTAITGLADDVGATTGQIHEGVTVTAFSTTAPNMGHTGGQTVTNNVHKVIEGIIVVTGSGDLELWHGSETASTTTLLANSSLIITPISAGADLAEIYGTMDAGIKAGDVVSLDSSLNAGVKKSDKPYDTNVFGIIATSPNLVMGNVEDAGATPVMVALAGRVPVKVTTENGPIKPGDLLTSSSTPGVAMRATKAGQVIGQAMMGFNGEGIGEVLVFVKTDYGNGTKLADLFPGVDVSEVDYGKMVLGEFISQKQNAQGYDLSEIVTDRVAAGFEVITPRVVADEIIARSIRAERIEGLDILVSSIKDKVLSELRFGSATESAVIASTSTSLSVNLSEAIPDTDEIASSSRNDDMAVWGLSVENEATVSGSLRVKNNTLIEGVLTVVDTMTTTKLIVSKMADFFGEVIFNGDVFFRGRPTFNKDTAGLAVIKKGADRAEVTFEKEYKQTPVVNVSINIDQLDKGENESDSELETRQKALEQKVLESSINYAVTRKTAKGFVIVLNKAVDEDTVFSWTALAVDQLSVSSSQASDISKPVISPSFIEKQATESLEAENRQQKADNSVVSPTPTVLTPQNTLTISHNELGFLRVREASNADSEEIGKVDIGATFEILEEEHGWYKIEYWNGKIGWVSGSYVTVNN